MVDETYISEADTNFLPREGDATYKGIATGNRVYFGYGITWNAGISYKF